MLKKILIALLIVALLVSGGVYYSYKKLEAKFESIMFAEVEKKRAEAEKALLEKLKLEELNVTTDEELVEVVPETDEVNVDETDVEEVVESEVVIEDVSETETSETDTTSLETETIPDETTTSEAETTPKEETVVEEEIVAEEETVVEEVVVEEEVVEVEIEEAEPVEVYTEEDFERDKKIALDLAMSRLSASQLSKLIDLSDDGFTPDEKVEAKEMFYSNFSITEQEWILGIYDKYYDLVNEG